MDPLENRNARDEAHSASPAAPAQDDASSQPRRTRQRAWRDHIFRIGRFLARWLFGIWSWLVFLGVMALFGGLILLLRQPRRGRCIARAGVRCLFRLTGMPVTAHGLATLPSGPHVLLVNHASFLDALALIALLPCLPGYAFAVRQEFPSQRFLCPLLAAVGTLVLPPQGTGSGMRAMASFLRRGDRLVIFPEAGFLPAPGVRPFHSGALLAAGRCGVPVVAAGLRGTRAALPEHHWLPRRIPLSLHIGRSVVPLASDLPAQLAALRNEIAVLCGEPVAP